MTLAIGPARAALDRGSDGPGDLVGTPAGNR